MARQIGEHKFEGTVDGLCFYKMEGEYYVRMQSSLTGKKFWKAACFEGSRRSCRRLSRGSQLAAMVYSTFRKQKGMYAALKSKAIFLLKKNTREDKIIKKLLKLSFQLQPLRSHSTKNSWFILHQEQKAERMHTPLFRISSLYIWMNNYNRYLSSA